MKKRIRFIILIVVLSLVLISCGKDVKLERYQKTFYGSFDTVITFLSYEKSEEDFNKKYEFVESEYSRLHKLYDRYKKYDNVTNIYTVNKEAHQHPVKVEDELYKVLKYGKEQYEKTLGKVNIAMGSVLEIWHNAREANEGLDEKDTKLPDRSLIEEAGKHMDINSVVLDDKEQTVFIKDDKVSLDLGAVAKGYATEIVANELKDMGTKHATINAGGNVRTIGNPGDGRQNWGIGLQNPDLGSEEFLDVLFIGETSIVTSGDYQRFFMHDGKSYHHIVDPKTLEPGGEFNSVTIVAKDSGLADILSTAIYLSDEEEAKKILDNYKEDDDLGVVWYSKDKGEKNTPNLDAFLKSKGVEPK